MGNDVLIKKVCSLKEENNWKSGKILCNAKLLYLEIAKRKAPLCLKEIQINWKTLQALCKQTQEI